MQGSTKLPPADPPKVERPARATIVKLQRKPPAQSPEDFCMELAGLAERIARTELDSVMRERLVALASECEEVIAAEQDMRDDAMEPD